MALDKAAAVAHYVGLLEEMLAYRPEPLVAKEAEGAENAKVKNRLSAEIKVVAGDPAVSRKGKDLRCVHCQRMGAGQVCYHVSDRQADS